MRANPLSPGTRVMETYQVKYPLKYQFMAGLGYLFLSPRFAFPGRKANGDCHYRHVRITSVYVVSMEKVR